MGSSILDRYQPGEILESGAADRLWIATERETGARVLLWAFRCAGPSDDPELLERQDRWKRDLHSMRQLGHPFMGRILECEEEGPGFVVVEEHVGGWCLASVLGIPVEPAKALSVVGLVGRAVEHATGLGMYHGDICPANITLLSEGVPKLVHWGVRRWPDKTDIRYVSPEELTEGRADARSDLYCLGLILAELLLGRHPFGSGSIEEIHEHIRSGAVPRLPEAPEHLSEFVSRLLARDPEERYATWGAAAADLARLRAPLPAGAPEMDVDTWEAIAEAGVRRFKQILEMAEAQRTKRRERERRSELLHRVLRRLVVVRWVAIGAATATLLAHAIYAAATEHTLTVIGIAGDVRVGRAEVSIAERRAEEGEELSRGDLVETGMDGQARLVLGDGSRLFIGPNTRLSVVQVGTRKQKKSRVRHFQVQAGSVYCDIRRRPDQEFVLQTPVGTTSGEGARYALFLEPPGLFRVEALSGVVAVDAGGTRLALPAGKQTEAPYGGPPADPMPLYQRQARGLLRIIVLMRDRGPLATVLNGMRVVEDWGLNSVAQGLVVGVKQLASGQHFRQGAARKRAEAAMSILSALLEETASEGGYPATLDPVTLAQVEPSADQLQRIQAQLHGGKLEYYRRVITGYQAAGIVDDGSGDLVILRNGKIRFQSAE